LEADCTLPAWVFPTMLRLSEEYEVEVGLRHAPGGSVGPRWSLHRHLLR
jgi:hypothetical protein